MSFQGRLVRLRARTRSDAELFTLWVNDPEVTLFLANGYPAVSREQEERLLEEWVYEPHVFSIETLAGQLIGNCKLFHVDLRHRSAELGIVIGDKNFWGRGYGTDSVALLLAYAFDHLGLHRVMLRHLVINTRGHHAYIKCGFREEGRLREAAWLHGRWHDDMLMSILEHEWRAHRAAASEATDHARDD